MKKSSDIISRLSMNRMTYGQTRQASKLSLFASFFVLFKSTVGLGLFSYPFIFSKVGIGYGIIFGSVICYITTYGIYTLAEMSSRIETKEMISKFESYDGKFSPEPELVVKVASKAYGKKLASFLSTSCIFGCVVINGTVVVGAIIEISHFFSDYFGTSQLTFKFVIIAVYMVLSAIIIEPEKLKPFAFLSAGVVISIGRVV